MAPVAFPQCGKMRIIYWVSARPFLLASSLDETAKHAPVFSPRDLSSSVGYASFSARKSGSRWQGKGQMQQRTVWLPSTWYRVCGSGIMAARYNCNAGYPIYHTVSATGVLYTASGSRSRRTTRRCLL